MERIADHQIHPLFLERWSPRAMNGQRIADDDLKRVFEAARWAPSSANGQPWRFVYALAGTPHFDKLFRLLREPNKPWCALAGALIVVASRKTLPNGQPARTHSYDTGAAWMSLALQGNMLGLVVHGMAGFDYDRAKVELEIPDEYDVEAMIALGYPGKVEHLPEAYQAREVKSGRRPIRELVSEGTFQAT